MSPPVGFIAVRSSRYAPSALLRCREAGAAPNCPQGEQLRGKWGDHGYEAEWDYWTRNGQWITWTGHVGYRFRHPEVHGVGPDNLLPSFHNSGTDGWTMRILFRCMPTAPA